MYQNLFFGAGAKKNKKSGAGAEEKMAWLRNTASR